MSGIILYQSKYGSTRKYAQWLSKMTDYPWVETKKADIREFSQYDTVILGGGVYASKIAGLSFLKRHRKQLQGKRILVFAVGASPEDGQALETLRQKNLRGSLEGVPLFYCRGAWDLEEMTWLHRTLCSKLIKNVQKKDPSQYEPWEEALMDASDGGCDWTDKGYLTPILEVLEK